MEIWINPPRLQEDTYALTNNLLDASSGPLAYDWNNYRPEQPPRKVDPTEEACYYSFGNHAGAPMEVDVRGVAVILPKDYDTRFLSGGSIDNTEAMAWFIPEGHTVVAFRPRPGIAPEVQPVLEFDRDEEINHFYAQFTGCRYLNWTLPMMRRVEMSEDPEHERGMLPGRAWVPYHLEDCEEVAAQGAFIVVCDIVEIHNELPWNTAPADWEEQRALFDRTRIKTGGNPTAFPWDYDWADWSDSARADFNKVKRNLAARMGRVAQALVANGQKEVVIGGQTTSDADYTKSIAAQQLADVTDPKGIRYALGGYVGHGEHLKALYDDTSKGYDPKAFRQAAVKDIEAMSRTWKAMRLWLDERFPGYAMPLDLYETGIHPPGAGAGMVDPRALELMQKAQDDGTLEEVLTALLKEAEEAGIQRVALFEGPRPPKLNDPDPMGLRFFPLQTTHALDTPRMKTLSPFLKGKASDQLQELADNATEKERFDEFFRLVGARYPMLDDLLSAGADIIEEKAPNYAADLIPWLRRMVELMRAKQ